MTNALTSADRVERIFPQGHPLYALVRPTFDTVRRAMGGHLVSAIWMDSNYFPDRAGYRISYDELYGEGSINIMPFIASWLSTGPGSEPDGNIVVLPGGIDRSIVQYAQDIGLLGAHAFISSVADIRALIDRTGRRIYAIDDMGPDFGADVVVSSELSYFLNSKDSLEEVSAYAPEEIVGDMFEVGVDEFRAVKQPGGRVFLKTCNTEAAGAGVFVCDSESDFERQLGALRDKQLAHGLSRTLVIQPEILGRNRSFQVFLQPDRVDEIQVIALTDQLVEADGKTYKGSINHPANQETLARVGPVIIDMIGRVRARFPEAFGIVMCDFFETPDGKIVVYDPGIRPTGNTATAMAYHFARKIAGRELHVSNFHLMDAKRGLTYGEFVERAGALATPDHIAKDGTGVLPWGWNDVLGFGVLIGVAPSLEEWEEVKARVLAIEF